MKITEFEKLLIINLKDLSNKDKSLFIWLNFIIFASKLTKNV